MDRAQMESLCQNLARELEEARAALPAHSMRPWQWQRVEDLEERLAQARAQLEASES